MGWWIFEEGSANRQSENKSADSAQRRAVSDTPEPGAPTHPVRRVATQFAKIVGNEVASGPMHTGDRCGGLYRQRRRPPITRNGWRVKAMSRRADALFDFDERLELVQADMRDEGSLRQAVAEVAVVVHLAAAKSDEPDSEDVNVRGAERLIKVCQAVGCDRIINISTQSAEIAQKGTYARTKSAAEKIFHNSGLQVTTLRLSVVYGEEESGVFGTVLKFVRRLPVVPVLGDGRWLSAPVYVGDVSKAIIACIENDNTIGKIYFVGGPECIYFDTLIDRICSALGVRRRKLHIPFSISLWAARTLVALWPECPITVSNVLGSNQNTEVDIERARKDFGFDPLSLDEGLAIVLGLSGSGSPNDSDQRIAADFKLIAGYLIDADPLVETG